MKEVNVVVSNNLDDTPSTPVISDVEDDDDEVELNVSLVMVNDVQCYKDDDGNLFDLDFNPMNF